MALALIPFEDWLLSQGYKICPICGTHAHRNAALCSTCGATLADVPVTAETARPSTSAGKPQYDRRYGETDLLEGGRRSRSEVYLFGGMVSVVALACVGVLVVLALRWLSPPSSTPTVTPPTALASLPAVALETNTPLASPVLSTVTPPPPPPTNTATPGPCTHVVKAGDDLISIAIGCGHHSMDVMPLILEMNGLASAAMIHVGQEISVPWPTPTLDPNAAAQPTGDTSASSAAQVADAGSAPTSAIIPGLELASAGTPLPPTGKPSATLLPGVMWHTVQSNENIMAIAFSNNTNVQVLSQLNPEITFSQCDFGNPAGGPECTVLIHAGQRIRVPAPTPTATLSPTLSGSETATPTLTPTFNAPSALTPADRALFRRDELITLRWVGSGTLDAGETYRVRVEDLTAGTVYSSDTTDLSFILPADWQGQDGQRHDYRWQVSVIKLDNPNQPIFTTEPRTFTWEGR